MSSSSADAGRRESRGAQFVDAAIGTSYGVWSLLSQLAQPVKQAAGSDFVARVTGPAVRPLAERGRRLRAEALRQADARLSSLAPIVVEAAASRVDLTAVVRDHVDINELIKTVDLTAVVRENVDIDELVTTVDVDAIVDRLDLIGLANYVIDGVDLPGIIRESSISFTSEAVRGVRVQGAEADQAIARVVDRLRLRHRDRTPLPGVVVGAGEDGDRRPGGNGHGPE